MHNLPEAYQEPTQRMSVGNGVEMFVYGNNKGLAHWFKVIELHNQAMSETTGIECFDEVEMVYIQTEKLNIVSHQVGMIQTPKGPVSAFKRNPDLKVYEADYNRWKQGLGMPGTALSKWDMVGVGQRATLEAEGIFTVEQVAEMSQDRINKFPPGYIELQEKAKQHVNKKTGNIDVKDYGKTLVENQRTIAALQAQIDMLTGKSDEEKPEERIARKINERRRTVRNSVVIDEPETPTAA